MAIFKKETGSNTPIPYSVGPLNIVPLTYAQYEALTPAEKNNGTVYNITDRSFLLPTAGDIDYDNTTSGSTETKVQGELDKLESGVKQLNSDLSELKYETPDLELTAMSDMTGQQVLDWLYTNIDRTKLTPNSIVWLDNHTYRYQYCLTYTTIMFAFNTIANNAPQVRVFQTDGTTKSFYYGSTSVLSSYVVSTGRKIKVFY